MRTKSLLLLFLLFVGCATTNFQPNHLISIEHLDDLYKNHQYFELRDQLTAHKKHLPEKEYMIINSRMLSAFNRRKDSDSLIEKLFTAYLAELTPEQQINLLETKISNNLFLFNYSEAGRSTEKLLSISSIEPKKKKIHENQLIIFQELESTPPQKAEIAAGEIPLRKDIAGLSRIPVVLNDTRAEVVFDTGANFSVITDSLALKAGIDIKHRTFKVTSITGEKIDSRIGVAESIQIGNSFIYNVVFLVFPESSLSFNNGQYTIDAILGFPVINSLEKVQLIQGKSFAVSKADATSTKENMALDFLTPVIEVRQKGKSLAFTFDTGATTTALYEEYFKLKEESIMKIGIRDSINLGGAGGAVKVPIYKAPFHGSIGESEFELDSANVYAKDQVKNPGIYGNLGQDVLQQFDTISLDFRNMRIMLK